MASDLYKKNGSIMRRDLTLHGITAEKKVAYTKLKVVVEET